MKHKEFIDELKSLGVVFEESKRHYKASFNGKQTVVKRHPSQDNSKNVYVIDKTTTRN